ncbi:MAG: EAL domain-containing protein (putative c-di-GMP-specific phosphodiesterase class I) [Parasphingorhabdus sp.]|jgi:EAL domain-containing protein (putative c-di-GMP-specific phosphodiesterase class I)/CRP-like cAMP-binding protein
MKLSQYKTQFSAGEYLFQEGDHGDCAYIIESGQVEISINKASNKMIIATLGKGDLVGEMAIIDQFPRIATALVQEDTNMLVIPMEYIRQKVDCSDPIIKLFLEIVLERYRDMHIRLTHVFEGITPDKVDDYQDLYQDLYTSTTNVVKDLMTQYNDMQNRILTAVNTSRVLPREIESEKKNVHQTTHILTLEQNLEKAIMNEEFELHYQPIVDIQTNALVGCEALVRWNHPEKGMISPLEFIPLAESSGLIVSLGYWIARKACEFQNKLDRRLSPSPFVSINLSGKQFDEIQLVPELVKIISETGSQPESIKFEITESLLMTNIDLAKERLAQLKESGVSLAIDDFGTGYSSFSYLHQLPFDTLKIDRSFVSTMVQSRKSRQIVMSLINMSHDLEMNIVTEGIETEFELELIGLYGAEFGQGYHFSRPLKEDDFFKLLD